MFSIYSHCTSIPLFLLYIYNIAKAVDISRDEIDFEAEYDK